MEARESLVSSEEGEVLSERRRISAANSLVNQLQKLLRPLLGLIIITAFFMILAPTYRQWPAIRDILEQSTVMLILATGTTVVVLSGNLDLSDILREAIGQINGGNAQEAA